MKILYLHQYFNTPEMTGSVRSYEMARHLVSQGHEVHMITICREQTENTGWFTSVEAGVFVHWLPLIYSNKLNYFKRLQVFVKFAIHSALKARNIGGDIVFATSTPLTIAIPAVFTSKALKIPMVFEVRDQWPKIPIALGVLKNPLVKLIAQWLERFAYDHATRIIVLSSDMQRGVVDVGVPAKKITVIPNIANIKAFEPSKQCVAKFKAKYPEIGNRKIVLYTGTFGVVNGLLYLVHLAKEVKQLGSLDICFIAIGDGVESQMLKQEAIQSGVLGDNFFIFPPVAKVEIPDIMNVADLIISLVINVEALWANSANKFFDGLASGTPVAINYAGWQAEILEKTKSGIVLSPDDPKAGAIELINFFAIEQRCKAAGLAALQLAKEQFERDILTHQFETVLLQAYQQNRDDCD